MSYWLAYASHVPVVTPKKKKLRIFVLCAHVYLSQVRPSCAVRALAVLLAIYLSLQPSDACCAALLLLFLCL